MTIRIGLIDDHPVVIGGLEAALNAIADFDVAASAGHLSDGAALLARDDIDVVLLDVRLADGNGLSLLRADRPARPAVIVLSSFKTTQYVSAAVRFGAQGFLLKTAPLDDVAQAIRQVAGGGSWCTAEQLRAGATGFVTLTPRDREVLLLVLGGHSNDEIAARLRIATKTVEAQLSRLFERFGVMSRLELGLRAEREAWLDLEPG
jgi:DNA-binding NarL/FixJ family response regulator